MIAAALLACALNVAPTTLEAIIRAEGGGNPLALHVNKFAGPQPHATTVQEAASITRRFVAAGFTVDLGHMQINTSNLAPLGYTIEDAFDSCANIKGGGAILTADYVAAAERFGEGPRALKAAISAYNTGDFDRGFANGYVARVTGIPAIPLPSGQGLAPAKPPNPYTAPAMLYSRVDLHVRVE
jgi:type IV secretion system protein VirB1